MDRFGSLLAASLDDWALYFFAHKTYDYIGLCLGILFGFAMLMHFGKSVLDMITADSFAKTIYISVNLALGLAATIVVLHRYGSFAMATVTAVVAFFALATLRIVITRLGKALAS